MSDSVKKSKKMFDNIESAEYDFSQLERIALLGEFGQSDIHRDEYYDSIRDWAYDGLANWFVEVPADKLMKYEISDEDIEQIVSVDTGSYPELDELCRGTARKILQMSLDAEKQRRPQSDN